jgi:hypothetical protein
MDYVQLVLFAIQAAIRLGQKLQTVFEDETRDNPLVLPPVPGSKLPTFDEAEPFFESEQGKTFVAISTETDGNGKPIALGMYAELWQRRNDMASGGAARDQLVEAFARIRALQDHSTSFDTRGTLQGDHADFLAGTNALFVVKQWRDGDDPKRHPVQRIAGTIVNIALDYAQIDPRLFGGKGRGDQLARAFLASLDKVDFAESTFDDLLVDVFDAAVRTIAENSGLVVTQEHWSLLLKKVSLTLAADFEKASGNDDKLEALYTFRRELLQDALKTAVSVVGEHPERFLGSPHGDGDVLLQGVLKGVLGALQDEPKLFTGHAAAAVFAAAMRTAAQNIHLVVPDGTSVKDDVLRQLLTGVAQQLAASARTQPPGMFTPDLLKDVAAIALEVTATNAARLIVPSDPRKQLLRDALGQITTGFLSALQRGGEVEHALRTTLSRANLLAITRQGFAAVAANPTGWLGPEGGDPRKAALAQVIGAIAQAIAEDPAHLLNGDDYARLVGIALEAVARNPDRLLRLDTADPRQQVLTRVITAVMSSASKNVAAGGRNLLTGDALREVIATAITAVSSNVDGFEKAPDIVTVVADRLLHASSAVLKNELDANTLLRVFGPILSAALKRRSVLDASDADLILPLLNAA